MSICCESQLPAVSKESAKENSSDQSPDSFVAGIFSTTHPRHFVKLQLLLKGRCVNRLRFGCHQLIPRMAFASRQTSKWRGEMFTHMSALDGERRKIKCFSGLDTTLLDVNIFSSIYLSN